MSLGAGLKKGKDNNWLQKIVLNFIIGSHGANSGDQC